MNFEGRRRQRGVNVTAHSVFQKVGKGEIFQKLNYRANDVRSLSYPQSLSLFLPAFSSHDESDGAGLASTPRRPPPPPPRFFSPPFSAFTICAKGGGDVALLLLFLLVLLHFTLDPPRLLFLPLLLGFLSVSFVRRRRCEGEMGEGRRVCLLPPSSSGA